jgi:DNA (cytosine-5)-methyltransferase 1
MTYKVVDLFTGTGAFSYVFNKYGCECVFANDIEPTSELIYKANFPSHKFELKDLNKINVEDIPSHDILCGGFPCQSFSIAGAQKGFEDVRANVVWKIIEILRHHQPKIVILENVKNLQSHDNGNTFKTIETNLVETGYHIKYAILDTCKVTNVPQHRERIYIVGFKEKELYDAFEFPVRDVAERQDIVRFLEETVADKYYYTDIYKSFQTIQNGITQHVNENAVYQFRRQYVRANKSKVCPTLTANMGGGGHNVPLILDDKGVRKLTPRECFNLQGFPRDYKLPQVGDNKVYKLAGNAVSVPVVEKIVEKLVSIIN